MAAPATTYLALADRLEEELAGAAPGTRLVSEHELRHRSGVSRITARAAIQELERRHLVRRQQGSGTFVALRIPYPVRTDTPPSWSEVVRRAGHRPGYQLHQIAPVRADQALAGPLAVERGARLTRVVRSGLINGQVATHATIWLPSRLVPRLGRHLSGDRSLTTVLARHYGLDTRRWWAQAELTPAPPEVADALDLAPRRPAWLVRSLNRAGRPAVPVELARSWMRADCFRVRLEVGPVPTLAPDLESP